MTESAPTTASSTAIRRVCVVGSGTMGHGIAQVAAQAGFTVTLVDVEQAFVDRGLGRVRDNLEGGVKRGKVSAEDRDATLARLSGSVDLGAAAAGADWIVEAIPEVLDLKRKTFATIEAACGPSALIASNTSSLRIGLLAQGLRRPERFLGMHFFNPVHIQKLLEIVVGDATSPETVERARAVGTALGKTSIVVRDIPGFASSRLGIALGMEAIRMLETGVASATDIDRAMTLGYAHPMGPLELTDLVGLDVRLAIADYLATELGPRFAPPDLLRQKVASGQLGKKSGQGFYRWQDGKTAGEAPAPAPSRA